MHSENMCIMATWCL